MKRIIIRKFLVVLFVFSLVNTCTRKTDAVGQIQLPFEESNGLKTATYEETIAFCEGISSLSDMIHYEVFGQSTLGFDLPLLIVDKDGFTKPDEIDKSGKVVLLVQANIHPGEPDGNDAAMLLVRDFVRGKKLKLLENITLLFIPVLNADGLHRFGSYNRINQNGPEMMGWRTNGQNLNLNRDFVKAETPEIAAWLKLFNLYQPHFFIDCHTTDGADYQYVITYAMETLGNMDEGLTKWQNDEYLPFVEREMFATEYPIFPYVSFQRWHDPRSGLIQRVGRPMLSQGYTALRNCPGLLIETHMLKPYKFRVLSTKKMIELTMELLNQQSQELLSLIDNAEKIASREAFRNKLFPLKYKKTNEPDTVEFLGVNYSVEKSKLTGGNWYKYKTKDKKVFQLPMYIENVPDEKVQLPEAYIIPPSWKEVIQKLQMHGLPMHVLKKSTTIEVETYVFSNPKWSNSPYEGCMTLLDFQKLTRSERVNFPAGSVVFDMANPKARLLAYALEPGSPDSYLRWGFFNAIFEQKEYAESYVMEGLAREMIQKNPALKQEFEEFKRKNPEIENNSWAQLNWFYKRTEYWDTHKNVYPVRRIMKRNLVESVFE